MLLSVDDHFFLLMLQFAIADKVFATLQATLIEDDDIANFFLQFRGKFVMELSLFFPNRLEFVKIILTIENDVL